MNWPRALSESEHHGILGTCDSAEEPTTAELAGAHGLTSNDSPLQTGCKHMAKEHLEIRIDDLTGVEVIALLKEHLACMARVSPPQSRHALDLQGLRQSEITFWSVWTGGELAGCGALKELDKQHGEIKSMRTAYAHQRRGVATRMLRHIIEEATRRGYRRLSLETGSMDYFEPARKFYARFGFQLCGPFGPYVLDPNSVFMTKELNPAN